MMKLNMCLFYIFAVYVMLSDFYEFQGLLVALKMRGLTDTGEYVVVGVDAKEYDSADPQKYIEGILFIIFSLIIPFEF